MLANQINEIKSGQSESKIEQKWSIFEQREFENLKNFASTKINDNMQRQYDIDTIILKEYEY